MIKTHRPALGIACVLALGIMVGKFMPVPFWVWLVMSCLSTAIYAWKKIPWMIFLSIFLFGAFLINHRDLLPVDSIAFLSANAKNQITAVEGIIETDGQYKQGRSIYELRVRHILMQGRQMQATGKLLLNVYGYQEFLLEYGSMVRVQGRIKEIKDSARPKGFSYRRYLHDQGVYAHLTPKPGGIELMAQGQGHALLTWIFKLRRLMKNIFMRYLNQREAGFVAAIVIGDRGNMPNDLKEIFVNTGTAHILAISGMNMAIIGALFFFILRACFVSRQVHFWGTILFLFAYALLSGWSAPVVRACIMSAVILASFALEHEGEPLNSLGLATVIILLMDPRNLFDAGFQLSFGAVFGILTLFKPCQNIFKIFPKFICDSVSLSVSAWSGTVIVILYHFHMLTPIAILANIPIVPLADMIMALGLGLAMVGGWCPFLGFAFAGCLKAALSTMIICAQWFNQIPYGHITI